VGPAAPKKAPISDLVAGHPVSSFFVLAYTISWGYWIPLALSGLQVAPGSRVTHLPGLLGPALAAIIVAALTGGASGVRGLLRRAVLVSHPGWRFWLYSLSPLGFLALAIGLGALLGRPLPSVEEFGRYSGLPAIGLAPVLLLVFLGNGLGEELGWRGFALPRLQLRCGALGGTLVLAVLWAGWHLPAFFMVETYRQMSALTVVGGFGLGLASGALVLARVCHQTQGSVLAAALWHTSYNMTSATAAGRGIIAAVTTACVMIWAGVLVLGEWRRPRETSLLSVPAAA